MVKAALNTQSDHSGWWLAGAIRYRLLLVALLLTAIGAAIPAQNHRGPAEVEAVSWDSNVYLGESFIFQIRIMNGLRIAEPDLSDIDNFEADDIPRRWLSSYAGDGFNPNRIGDGTHFFYRMIAQDTGVQTIPSITVRVDGEEYQTEPVQVTVELPPEQTDFKLSLELAKSTVYVGEPVTLRAVWYFRDNAAFYTASMPILRHPDISVVNKSSNNSGSRLFLRMPSGSSQVAGSYGQTTLAGRSYQTVSFEQIVTPQSEGSFSFPPATVQVWQAERRRDRSGGSNWRSYDQTVVGSNFLSLEVRPLPETNRPPEFTGVIGERLEVNATLSHTDLHVGDPATLEITLSGPPSLAHANIPDFSSRSELNSSFAFGPGEMRASVGNDTKTFSQTIRVKDGSISEVPPMEFAYFNTTTGSYESVASNRIPISVLATGTSDGGSQAGPESDSAVSMSSVRSYEEGVRFNYAAGLDENERSGFASLLGSPFLLLLLGVSMAFLAGSIVYRQRHAPASSPHTQTPRPEPAVPQEPRVSDASQSARRLYDVLDGAIAEGNTSLEQLFSAWKVYLRTRFSIQTGTLTEAELDSELARRGRSEEIRHEVQQLFRREEKLMYGSKADAADVSVGQEAQQIRQVTEQLELELNGE